MRLRRVYSIVFRKEFRELLRDRRSLFWLFAPPIILPGIAICAGLFIGTQAVRIASEGFPITIENGDQAPELVSMFEEEEAVEVLDEVNSSKEAVMIVSISPNFEQELNETGTGNIRLITRDNSIISFIGKGAIRSVIDRYSENLLDERLESMGVDRNWLTPINVGERRISTTESVTGVEDEEEEGGGIIATIFLPLAVTSWLLGGGMGLVLDSTVGEKERQTIENLLVTPASRVGIVMGKMTVIFIASMAVMSLWLIEGLLLNALSVAGPELLAQESLSAGETLDIFLSSGSGIIGLILALVVMIVPFTVMLNGLVMGWCAYAANYREANLFMALVQLGLPASFLVTIFSLPADVANWFYAIPFFGTIVAIRDLFSSALPTSGLIINFTAGTIYAMGGVLLAAWVFGREWSLTRGLQ